MSKFEFRDELHIEISNHMFNVRVNNELGQALTVLRDKCIKISGNLDVKNMPESEIMNIAKEGFTSIFGVGAYEIIFNNRNASFQDVMDILFFVSQEIEKLKKRTLNRVAQRKKKK